MIRSWPLLFIVIPLVELYVIITVGGMIGAFWTVILVLLTAVIGVNLLRMQGMSTLMRAQQNMAQGSIPAMEMMEGIALAVAGVLLIMARSTVQTSFGGQSGQWQSGHQQQKPGPESPAAKQPKVGRTIEGEYRRED